MCYLKAALTMHFLSLAFKMHLIFSNRLTLRPSGCHLGWTCLLIALISCTTFMLKRNASALWPSATNLTGRTSKVFGSLCKQLKGAAAAPLRRFRDPDFPDSIATHP